MSNSPAPWSGFEEPDCVRSVDLGAYLLGGMDDSDALYMRKHIDTCPFCADEVREIRPVADLLSSAELASALVGERLDQPSSSIRDRIVQVATSEAQHDANDAGHLGLTSTHQPRGSRKRLVAASVVAFGLGVGSVFGGQNLAASPAKRPGEKIPFTKISLSRPNLPNGGAPKAWASVRDEPAGTYAYLWVSDFEIGRTYKWWFLKKDGTRVPLGSFVYPGKDKESPWLICPGSTSVKRSELVGIGATDANGVDVANEKLPPPPPRSIDT